MDAVKVMNYTRVYPVTDMAFVIPTWGAKQDNFSKNSRKTS